MRKGILIGVILFCKSIAWAQSPCDSLPVVNISSTDTNVCLGGEVTLTATGGINYQWNNGIANGVPFTPATTQDYEVIVTDTLGCVDTASIEIEVLPLPTIQANSSSLSICNGDSVLLEATGADSYNWITPSISNGSYYTPTVLGANTFVVEGTGSNGCVNNSQVIVVVHAIPQQPSLSAREVSTCLNVAFEEEVKGATNNGRVIWFADEALTNMVSDQPELPLSNNQVGITPFYAASYNNGCYSKPVEATVEVYPLPVVDAGEDVLVDAGTRGELVATANVPVSVTWTPEVNISNPYSLITEYTALESATYLVEVVDQNNCLSTDEVSLNVKSNLIISNIMTLDGNGENDTWKMYPEVVLQTCKVQLFDGFGRELISTDDYQNNWDGVYEGETVPDGDYYYYVNCSGGFSKKGTLTILR